MNRLVISGNICNDLEIRESGETKVLGFTVAVRRKYKNKEGEYPTDFIRCVAFNGQAEFISKYFSKGSPILLEGALQESTYEKDGEKRTSYNLAIENIDFFGGKRSENSAETITSKLEEAGVEVTVVEDEDLPF